MDARHAPEHADPLGVFAVTRQGHVRLPVSVRRWCGTGLPGVNTGDRHGELPRLAGAVVTCRRRRRHDDGRFELVTRDDHVVVMTAHPPGQDSVK
jgi:hypothetical protein